MTSRLSFMLRRALSALALVALWPTAAQAGLVTGNWDPAFGSFLPGLSWQVRATLLVPNACSAQGDGVYSTAGGACDQGSISVLSVRLRLFNTGVADPNDFDQNGGITPNISATWDMQGPPSLGYGVSKVRVEAGQVVGFEAGRPDLLPGLVLTPVYASTVVCVPLCESFPSAAEGNLFGLVFGVNGPVLECRLCHAVFGQPDGPVSVYGSTEGLTQFLVTYNDNDGRAPKFTDGQGNTLGARLNGAGQYLGQATTPGGASVPEPGAPLLVLTALMGIGFMRRRSA
jgi:hypothetical protein